MGKKKTLTKRSRLIIQCIENQLQCALMTNVSSDAVYLFHWFHLIFLFSFLCCLVCSVYFSLIFFVCFFLDFIALKRICAKVQSYQQVSRSSVGCTRILITVCNPLAPAAVIQSCKTLGTTLNKRLTDSVVVSTDSFFFFIFIIYPQIQICHVWCLS